MYILKINRPTVYIVVSLIMMCGYVTLITWYAMKNKEEGVVSENFSDLSTPTANTSFSDADINSNIIRNFNDVIKRFPTPHELKQTRDTIKELVADNTTKSSLSDISKEYIKKKFSEEQSSSKKENSNKSEQSDTDKSSTTETNATPYSSPSLSTPVVNELIEKVKSLENQLNEKKHDDKMENLTSAIEKLVTKLSALK